ncbi:MAG: hypothetical protein WD065_08915 [Planctomycetaceae bacterium]
MKGAGWKPGDWAIYRKQKFSTSPGPRAKDVVPATGGEMYVYFVEKYWIVSEVLGNGQLLLRTRRGKQHTVSVNDPGLRRPRWWERFFFGNRFRAILALKGSDAAD